MSDPHFDLKKYTPADTSIRIWRYMNLTRFASLLQSNSLYFAPLSSFDDPFEGSIPQHTIGKIWKRGQEDIAKNYELLMRYTQSFTANCWHMNDHESEALWKLYSVGGPCIAVQSTFEKVRRQMPHKVIGVQIQYLDYETEGVGDFSKVDTEGSLTLSPKEFVSIKRKSFEHEREIRFFIAKHELRFRPVELAAGYRAYGQDGSKIAEGGKENDPIHAFSKQLREKMEFRTSPDMGDHVKVNLHDMVERICISPFAKDWEASAIEDIAKRYDCSIPINRSDLLAHPKLALQRVLKS